MKDKRKGFSVLIAAGLALSVALALFLAPLASSQPDGLERVAEDKGFAELAENDPAWDASPFADYELPQDAAGRPAWATGIAGLAGTVTVFLVAWGAALLLRRRDSEDAADG